jgi:hypothetical protein
MIKHMAQVHMSEAEIARRYVRNGEKSYSKNPNGFVLFEILCLILSTAQ